MHDAAPAVDVSVVIVNWNTPGLLADCLRSLRRCGGVTSEVIVVDNGSTDGSPDLVRKHFPEVRLIANENNLGFAKANNQGFAAACGRYLLVLNSDTVVPADAPARLVAYADAHPDAGMVGPRLLNADGSLQWSSADLPTLPRELLGVLGRRRRRLPGTDAAFAVGWLAGACILVRRAAWEQVGGFDEAFFMYSEDTDWCRRMHAAGWGVVYLADVSVTHLGSGSAPLHSPTQLERLYDAKVRYFTRHHGPAAGEWLRRGLVVTRGLGLLRRVVVYPLHRRAEARARARAELAARWHLVRFLKRRRPTPHVPHYGPTPTLVQQPEAIAVGAPTPS